MKNNIGHKCAQRHAFTLMELLLALGLSGLIGVAVAMMLRGVAMAAIYHDDANARSIDDAITRTRLAETFRRAVCILQSNEDGCVLWLGDTRKNAHPDLSELLIIEHNSSKKYLAVYEAVTPLDADSDTPYHFDDDIFALTAALRNTPAFPVVASFEGVTEFRVFTDAPSGRRVAVDLAKSHAHGNSECRIVVFLGASRPSVASE